MIMIITMANFPGTFDTAWNERKRRRGFGNYVHNAYVYLCLSYWAKQL